MRLPLQLSLPSTSAASSSSTSFVVNEETGELVLVELQGELELSRDGKDDDEDEAAPSQAGQRIGKLDLSVPGRPTLLIGHHRLIGKVVKLNTPMAILKHTLPPRAPTPSSSTLPYPSSSSPIRPEQSTKRARSSSLPDEASDELQVPAAKRVNGLTTPSHSDGRTDGLLQPSSPLPPSSTPVATDKLPPQTPVNVAELKKGKHEIVGILRQKLLFSKRPEPMTKLDVEEDDD